MDGESNSDSPGTSPRPKVDRFERAVRVGSAMLHPSPTPLTLLSRLGAAIERFGTQQGSQDQILENEEAFIFQGDSRNDSCKLPSSRSVADTVHPFPSGTGPC